MKSQPPQPSFDPVRAIKKFFLAAFVVVSFIAYALHKPQNSNNAASAEASQPTAAPTTQSLNPAAPTATANPAATDPTQTPAAASSLPTTTPSAAAASPTPPAPTAAPSLASSQYKNGTFLGPQVDAFYGLVQVKVTIQNGKLTNVQFTEYPSDRRTSQQINSIAMPYLQQEAIQAQNANVDIISGATLTSEGFIQSLQAALSQAKG